MNHLPEPNLEKSSAPEEYGLEICLQPDNNGSLAKLEGDDIELFMTFVSVIENLGPQF